MPFRRSRLQCDADAIDVHVNVVRGITIAMHAKVQPNGLANVLAQIVGDLSPGLRVAAHLHNSGIRRARGALDQAFLVGVINVVVGSRPIPESERGGLGRTRNANGLVNIAGSIHLRRLGLAEQRTKAAGVCFGRRDGWFHWSANRPISETAGLEAAILNQIRRGAGDGRVTVVFSTTPSEPLPITLMV